MHDSYESIKDLDFEPASEANRRRMHKIPDQRIAHLDFKTKDPELKKGLELMSWSGSPEKAERAAAEQYRRDETPPDAPKN